MPKTKKSHCSRAGGKVAYVGEKLAYITELKNHGHGFINTRRLGPPGAVEFIRAILEHNSQLEE